MKKKSVMLALAAGLAMSGAAMGDTYSSNIVAPTPSSLQTSWSGLLDGTSPTFRRANGSSAGEVSPNTPTTQGGSAGSMYAYQVQTFVASSSSLHQFYSAQAFDGYLHLYQNAFDPLNPLTNILAGDDDMTTLNGGAVPNRNGVTSTNDSGFQFNLTAGTTYFVVTSPFSTGFPAAPNNNFYNEIYGGGTPGSQQSIPDNSLAGSGAQFSITIPNSNTDVIQSFDSLELVGLSHTWLGDLVVTLTHVESGLTVDILDRVDRVGTGTGNDGNLSGDYLLSDGGAAWPDVADIPAGSYATVANAASGSSMADGALASFIGTPLAGTWTLTLKDAASGDTGSLVGFRMNVTVPSPGAFALMGLGGLVAARRRRA